MVMNKIQYVFVHGTFFSLFICTLCSKKQLDVDLFVNG